MYSDILDEISGGRRRKCYQDLRMAVDLIVEWNDPDLTLYEVADRIGETTGMSRTSVMKSMERAVDDIWAHGDREALQQLYPFRLTERPVPKELIMRLAEYRKRSVEYQLCEAVGQGLCLVVLNPVIHTIRDVIPVEGVGVSMEQLIYLLNQTQASEKLVKELFVQKEPG